MWVAVAAGLAAVMFVASRLQNLRRLLTIAIVTSAR
jgi:hypothetical protein